MKKYFNYQIKKVLVVQNLVTVESLDLSTEFSYPVEEHSFYEFVYTDSGTIIGNVEGAEIAINQGDFYLIAPNKKHFYTTKTSQSASVFIVCFNCKSEFIELLLGKMHLEKEEKLLMASIVKEAQKTFVFPFNKKLQLCAQPKFGAQQLIENYIEELLIKLIRWKLDQNENIRFVMNSLELESSIVGDVIELLKSALYARLTLSEISEKTYYSKTYLNNIFKKNTGYSIMQYYNLLKIEEAKKLLREKLSTTVISDKLNFESPNYFTKVFKKYSGMTPSEYRKTIL